MEDTWDKNLGSQKMRIDKASCAGLIIDIQERLFPHMAGKEELLRKCLILVEGMKILKLPLLLTEQYPKGLGPTLEEIREQLGEIPAIEKVTFSCCDEPDFIRELERSACKTIVIAGIEAHVCVLQTVVDLVAEGYLPVVVADCISSRSEEDKEVAMQRMRAEGAVVSTCESILFELCRSAGAKEFKAISNLIK